MSAILISLIQNAFKFVVFIAIAWAGVVCGKKFRDRKDSKNSAISAENKEMK